MKDEEELERHDRRPAHRREGLARTFSRRSGRASAEQEIAARLQYLMLHYGAENMSFDPIVVSGANGSVPHGVPAERTIQAGEFVTMDFGCIYHGYCSDMTRTVAVGYATEEMQHGLPDGAPGPAGGHRRGPGRRHRRGGGRRRPGSDRCRRLRGRTSPTASATEWAWRSTSPPTPPPPSGQPLPAGAVISAEPGIYLPGKLGVRIEDVIVLDGGGLPEPDPGPQGAASSCKTHQHPIISRDAPTGFVSFRLLTKPRRGIIILNSQTLF